MIIRIDPTFRAKPFEILTGKALLVNQQLAFDCGNLRVNHAKAVQLTTAREGDVLYMIGEYFWFG